MRNRGVFYRNRSLLILEFVCWNGILGVSRGKGRRPSIPGWTSWRCWILFLLWFCLFRLFHRCFNSQICSCRRKNGRIVCETLVERLFLASYISCYDCYCSQIWKCFAIWSGHEYRKTCILLLLIASVQLYSGQLRSRERHVNLGFGIIDSGPNGSKNTSCFQ